jgi:hypothetical protein
LHPRRRSWPEPLGEAALHGVVGEILRIIGPETESDPAALVAQVLVAFGNAIGHSAHFVVDGVKHFLMLFAVLVGITSKGRKGTSWARICSIFDEAEPGWVAERIQGGLSSGEGLMWAVRDPSQVPKPNGRGTQHDPGVKDKRLMVVEPEMASVLRVCSRSGSILSPTIRQAWDSGNLRILTKNSPARATGAHISLIGHIGRDELLRNLSATEQGNGFANRFLFVCTRRSRLLPDGGMVAADDLTRLAIAVSEAVEYGQRAGIIRRDPAASDLWHSEYPQLSRDRDGMVGAMTSRAEAQTMRLACTYALLDQSPLVRVEHLRAALEVWRYCEDSVRYIFGESLGDPLADDILSALTASAEGMTRTELSTSMGRNVPAHEIERALEMLKDRGLARTEKSAGGPGRPTERWFFGTPVSRGKSG